MPDLTQEGLAARGLRVKAQIEDLEGEVMLAGFHGYSADHITPRLMALYDEESAIRAAALRKDEEPK